MLLLTFNLCTAKGAEVNAVASVIFDTDVVEIIMRQTQVTLKNLADVLKEI